MFVQIIEGTAKDVEGMRREMDRWVRELRPGAEGFLGSTAGVTDDGRAINLARFESRAAAQANSDRPEQGEWWSAMERCFDGEVTFTESEDVEQFLGGGSDEAGFVQVMKSSGLDRALVARLDETFAELAPTIRPDVIGGIRVWTAPDAAYDVTYFTSEAEARAAEAAGPPPELGELFAEYQSVLEATEFFDLTEPWTF
jgi:hypothetical protein